MATIAKIQLDPKVIEAEENLLIDCQILLQETIVGKGITRSALAQKAGISKARLSQLMRSEANPTVKTMARLFHALGEELIVGVKGKVCQTECSPNAERTIEHHWNWSEASSVAAKVDDAQFVALLKEASAKGAAASNDNYSPVVVMESDLMMTLEAA
ncbi:MAG: helix-turn-helix transcriptional regulator [Xanthobacteraceae bacterium]